MSNPFEDDGDEGLDAPQQSFLPGLDISEVEITTRSVTWHEMRYHNKLLSLSRFRQLMPETLVDEERVGLRGDPWFFVYHDPSGKRGPEHREFIVRFGKQLRRCPFRIRHIEGNPSARGRACEGDWPSPLHAIRDRHESLSLCALIDQAMQGGAALPEGFDRSHRTLAFPDRPPFAAHSFPADQGLTSSLVGAIDPGDDITVPPPPTTTLVPTREKKRHNWLTPDPGKPDPGKPDPGKPDPPVMTPRPPLTFSAVEHQRESRDQLRQFLESRGFTAEHPSEHWESLIEQNAEEASAYIERWNALMDKLLRVHQLPL